MSEIKPKVQKEILEGKLNYWSQMLFSAHADQQIASMIGEEDMEKNAVATMKKAQKAMNSIKEMLEEFEIDGNT